MPMPNDEAIPSSLAAPPCGSMCRESGAEYFRSPGRGVNGLSGSISVSVADSGFVLFEDLLQQLNQFDGYSTRYQLHFDKK